MLKQLTLENFKGLKKAEIDFGRITVFIGPNGTGKSSVAQALMCLRQSIGKNTLVLDGPLVSLGGFADVLSRDASAKEIGLRLVIEIATEYAALGIAKSASFSYGAYFPADKVARFDAAISIAEKKFLTASGGSDNPVQVSPSELVLGDHSSSVKIGLKASPNVATPVLIGSTSQRGQPPSPDVVGLYHRETSDLLSTITRLLNNAYLVPTVRGFDKPDYPLSNERATDFPPGSNDKLASTFAYAGRDLEKLISIWSEEITGSDIGVNVIPGKKVAVVSNISHGSIPVIGDGFGTNQLVQVLLTLATAPKSSIIAIEEPEIHLHPKAQKKLCDHIVALVKRGEGQIVITTHSEHILSAFVNAVKDGVLVQHDLALYHFPEKGAEPRRIDQDEVGDIYGDWQRNFFSYS